MQATVIKTIKETVGGSTLIYQKEFFVHSSPSKFFFGQTRVRRIIFNNTGFINLQMINRPHIRRKPFRTPTTDQRIKFRFITRNQAQHQCNERQQEELSFHNNNSSTPVPGRATNKQKKRRNCTVTRPTSRGSGMPYTVGTSNAEPTLLCKTHNRQQCWDVPQLPPSA